MTNENRWSMLQSLCFQRIHWLESRIAVYESREQESRPVYLLECYKQELACYRDLKDFVDEQLTMN